MKRKTGKADASARGGKQGGKILKRDAGKGLRILMLEDNPADSELVESELQNAGILFSALRVETRSDFLKALKTFRPDLILADFSLPQFDALLALALRNKMAPQIPFIVVTGSVSEETAVECMKQGADDYLLKDRLARLGEAIRLALSNRRLLAEKVAAEESLRASESMYRTFIDSSTDMAFLKDDRFRHLLANQALCRFYGKEEIEIIGKTDSELMDKRAAAKCRKTDKEALAEKRLHFSEEKIGSRTFETRKFPVKLADGRIGVGGYIRDISERKLAEKALLESEDKFKHMFEAANVGKSITLPTGEIHTNQAFCSLLGYTKNELRNKSWQELTPADEIPAILQKLQPLLSGKEDSARFNKRYIHKSGSHIWCDVSVAMRRDALGKPLHFITTIVDISERRKAEDALLEMNEIFRLFLRYNPIYVFIKDENIRPIYLSENYEKLLGRPLPEIIGKSMDELFPSALSRTMIADDQRILREGKTLEFIEELNGRVYSTVKFPIHIGGKAKYLAGYTMDITERKRVEEQIRASLQEKEVLLKEIHHRVKNNLQVISGLLTLQAAQTNDEKLQRMVKESQGRIWTMALIHQTLYQSGNLVDIDMADYIRSLAGNLLSSHAKAAMPPAIDFDLMPLRLAIDKAIPLGLIINELMTNAMKHAFPDGRSGEIRIALQECRGTTDGAPCYELTVADNGAGLPAGFDATKHRSLGLQLVTMLSKQLGGSMAIESSDGTSVHVVFTVNEKKAKLS
ncbi:MAG: PAS domain S-box protein [Acidobacteriota bacterium]|nr:PAS domain S-box protein [Acidobacteriota bacterium]